MTAATNASGPNGVPLLGTPRAASQPARAGGTTPRAIDQHVGVCRGQRQVGGDRPHHAAAIHARQRVVRHHHPRGEVRTHRIEKRDQGAYGLLVSRTALAFADPRFWNLEYAVRAILASFIEESQKPGKSFPNWCAVAAA